MKIKEIKKDQGYHQSEIGRIQILWLSLTNKYVRVFEKFTHIKHDITFDSIENDISTIGLQSIRIIDKNRICINCEIKFETKDPYKNTCSTKCYGQQKYNNNVEKEIIILKGETFKDVPGFEGFYKVSNLGNVWSCNRKTKRINGDDVFYSAKKIAHVLNKGYPRLRLSANGKRKTYYLHRLLGILFIPNPNNYPYI